MYTFSQLQQIDWLLKRIPGFLSSRQEPHPLKIGVQIVFSYKDSLWIGDFVRFEDKRLVETRIEPDGTLFSDYILVASDGPLNPYRDFLAEFQKSQWATTNFMLYLDRYKDLSNLHKLMDHLIARLPEQKVDSDTHKFVFNCKCLNSGLELDYMKVDVSKIEFVALRFN